MGRGLEVPNNFYNAVFIYYNRSDSINRLLHARDEIYHECRWSWGGGSYGLKPPPHVNEITRHIYNDFQYPTVKKYISTLFYIKYNSKSFSHLTIRIIVDLSDIIFPVIHTYSYFYLSFKNHENLILFFKLSVYKKYYIVYIYCIPYFNYT